MSFLYPMLSQLRISNFAIIKDLEISFGPGLSILSGETGAGKSIIINAINLLLGGRASADLIRTGCKEARVEALFRLPGDHSLVGLLEELGAPLEEELVIARSISLEGRNKTLINGSMVTLGMLSRIGSKLISISGQHEHQLLLRAENHLYLLDEFGGLAVERQELSDRHGQYQRIQNEFGELEREMAAISEKRELAQFQIQEIERAEIQPDEDERLEEQKRRLQHAEELSMTAAGGYQTLYEQEGSVIDAVSQCVKQLEKASHLDPDLKPTTEALADIQLKLEDVAYALRDFQKGIELDPDALETVLERLELLRGLKRKYGPTLEDVIRFKDELASQMYDLEEKRNRLQRLQKEREALAADLLTRAKHLSDKRKAVARRLEGAAEKELHQLHMKRTRFQVSFPQQEAMERIEEVGADGIDAPEFMISPNPGEDLRPLSKIASGGELSRIMLSLKTILAQTASVETVIFDEVDSGISGATAEVIGEKLLSLSGFHQILCITHLPQIASQGRTHFLVQKTIVGRRTQTVISLLEPEERVMEIARLLAGREITPQALAHAREMLSTTEAG